MRYRLKDVVRLGGFAARQKSGRITPDGLWWETTEVIPGLAGQSQGLGDTVAKVAHAVGADKVAKAYERATGKPCGCAERQAKLNRLVGYKTKAEG